MNAKSKAKELIQKYKDVYTSPYAKLESEAAECALVCVNEIIEVISDQTPMDETTLLYWGDVKFYLKKHGDFRI